MAKKPLRSQLNQIRAWVREGRTDAWIAHQLELPTAELKEFRRRHSLEADGEDTGEVDLRDEIEAEIEATMEEEEPEVEEEEEEEEPEEDATDEDAGDEDSAEAKDSEAAGDRGGRERAPAGDGEGGEGTGRRRRRRRRGGRGRGRGGRAGVGMQATFDHGEKDGYGLWLDPAVQDDPVYSEHWAGHRPVEVTVEADRIVIKRSEKQSR